MKIKLIILTILTAFFSNCKRYNNSENSKEIVPEKTSISKNDIQEVFEKLEEYWFVNDETPAKLAGNLLAIEMMFKDTFSQVVGLGRGRE